MSAHPFDVVTRRLTAAVSRRRSLVALGATALTAAVARPRTTDADDGCRRFRRCCKRHCHQAEERRAQQCLAQRNQCNNAVAAFCGANQSCIFAGIACCNLFDESCYVQPAVECLLAAQ